MTNIQSMLNKVVMSPSATMLSVNCNLMQISVSPSKKKSGFVKMAVDDETARGFMLGGDMVGFMVVISKEDYRTIVSEMSSENSESTESTQAQPEAER